MHNVARAVQERVTQHGTSNGGTMHRNIEGPINAISTNKDKTQVVVAGRNVFRVLSIEEEEFTEKLNLRIGKNLNLNFSASDVAWNQIEDHILASAATNGAVVTWNLNKSSSSKQDIIFQEHTRTVNKVCFHGTEANLLLSGSQDGFMKLFDLRKREASSTFSGQSESVRVVQFNPHQDLFFAAAFENGNIQIWDMRRSDRYLKQFVAHNDPVFTIDYHPDEKNWMATAGRDKTIKVWDLSQSSSFTPNNKVRLLHTIQTIASVARVKWRPQRKFHIASCALLLDFSVNVWDIRRPYIPFASFNEHKDVVTSILWKNDPHIFLSASKDQTVYQHLFRDANRPADKANTTCLAINASGEIAQAASLDKPDRSGKTSKLTNLFKKAPDRSDQFTVVHSTLTVFHDKNVLKTALDMDWFIHLAKGYKLSGKSIEDLCDQNSKTAASISRYQESQTWNMLKYLYCEHPTTPQPNTRSVSLLAAGDKNTENDRNRHMSIDHTKSHEKSTDGEIRKSLQHNDLSAGMTDEESGNASDSEQDRALATIASGLTNPTHDLLFEDGDLEQFQFNDGEVQDETEAWQLPSEVFTIRHEIADRSVSPDPLQMDSPSDVIENECESTNQNQNQYQNLSDSHHMERLFINKPSAMHFPSLDVTWQVCNMLNHYVEQGNVQMAVSVIIVLSDRIGKYIDEDVQENWFFSYIDLLQRYRLWNIATQVIKLSRLNNVTSLNQQSTTIHTNCNSCSKPLQKSAWLCDKCAKLTALCSICHLPVKSLFVWCQGCSHGGHLQHMRDWFKINPACPTGCGHLCEYE